jgi:hypothetical protein
VTNNFDLRKGSQNIGLRFEHGKADCGDAAAELILLESNSGFLALMGS